MYHCLNKRRAYYNEAPKDYEQEEIPEKLQTRKSGTQNKLETNVRKRREQALRIKEAWLEFFYEDKM